MSYDEYLRTSSSSWEGFNLETSMGSRTRWPTRTE